MKNHDFDVIIQNILKEAFKFTIDFLDSHQLRWWACGGTMLGAIRHNDMIPWDDDIDIMMPRDDYEKLLDLKDSFQGTNYYVTSIRDYGYPLTAAKICDRRTTIWEIRRFPFLTGVFIDIFPLDTVELSKDQYEKEFSIYRAARLNYQRSISNFTFQEALWDISHKHPNALLNGLKSLFVPKSLSEKTYSDLLLKEKMFDKGNGTFYVSPAGAYETREYFRKEWFNKTIKVQFADFEVNVPEEYDKYLTVMYGNYMKLPPIEKRVTHHDQYYINLLESIDMSEVRKRIKKGIFVEY